MPIGPNGQKRPADPMALAKTVMDIATGEAEEVYEVPKKPVSPERSERARKAAYARWERVA